MKRRVLIVDDSAVTTQRLADVLTSLGNYEIVGTAQNGSDGLKLVNELEPHIVLLDMIMPVMGGVECLRSIKVLRPNTQVVLISSMGGVRRKVDEALDNGASAVINKPFDNEDIRSVLADLTVEEE